MREPTFFESISMFKCRAWLWYNDCRGDTRLTYKNDMEEDLQHVNHKRGHFLLMEMIKQYRLERKMKNIDVYCAVTDVLLYREIWVSSYKVYRVQLDCPLSFKPDNRGNTFYEGYYTYNKNGGREFNAVPHEKVLERARACREYMRKTIAMPEVHQKKKAERVPGTHEKMFEELLRNATPEELAKYAQQLTGMR